MPYGAYEMKAMYQRNLSAAMLLTLGAVLAVVTVGLFWPSTPVKVILRDDRVVIKVRPIQPPSVSRDDEPFDHGRRSNPAVVFSIPEPVADSLISDVDEAVLPTRDESRWSIDQQVPPEGAGSGGFVIDTSQVDFIPPIDSFIKVEIYPEMIFEQKPDYPRLAQKAGITGTVWVSALVGENGSVQSAVVRRSSGTESLDQAAVDAARKCRYSPGIQNGRPVKVWVTYRVDFQLE